MACGPGSVCSLGVGSPVLLSVGAGSVLLSVGGQFRIRLGISTSASLDINGSCDCRRCCGFFGITCHLLFCIDLVPG